MVVLSRTKNTPPSFSARRMSVASCLDMAPKYQLPVTWKRRERKKLNIMIVRYGCGNLGWQVFKGGIKKWIDSWPKINIIKGNYCTLWIYLTYLKVPNMTFKVNFQCQGSTQSFWKDFFLNKISLGEFFLLNTSFDNFNSSTTLF